MVNLGSERDKDREQRNYESIKGGNQEKAGKEQYHYLPVEAIHLARQVIGLLEDQSKGKMKYRKRELTGPPLDQ